MIGCCHRLDGYEFEQAPGVGDGQGSLASCNPWGCKELDTTEQLNGTEFYLSFGLQHSIEHEMVAHGGFIFNFLIMILNIFYVLIVHFFIDKVTSQIICSVKKIGFIF